jgi:hypothetical protein
MGLKMKQFMLALVLVTIQHVCAIDDTLQSVAEQYCQDDNPRQVAEFRERIRELNYDAIGENRVWTGLVFKIISESKLKWLP